MLFIQVGGFWNQVALALTFSCKHPFLSSLMLIATSRTQARSTIPWFAQDWTKEVQIRANKIQGDQWCANILEGFILKVLSAGELDVVHLENTVFMPGCDMRGTGYYKQWQKTKTIIKLELYFNNINKRFKFIPKQYWVSFQLWGCRCLAHSNKKGKNDFATILMPKPVTRKKLFLLASHTACYSYHCPNIRINKLISA